jgi:hypothetical protein
MEIPSWAFASAGKSLSVSVSELAPVPVPVPVPAPVKVSIPLQPPEPIKYTLYDHITELINYITPKQNAFIDILIELYI